MSDEARLADARDKLAELRNGFKARLRERVAELEAAVQSASAGEAGGVQRTEALAHKLAGTAGSYGFPEVGEAAAELEALCDAGFDADAAETLLDRLRRGV